jgi:hypothetical protein
MTSWMRICLAVLLTIGLSGCFVSKESLIGDAQAVAPYQKIVYVEKGGSDATTLVKEGSSYLLRAKDSSGDGHIKFMQAGADLYVAQLEFAENDKLIYLYAFLKVDLAAKTVESYKLVAGDADAEPGPGLSRCDENDTKQVCIESLDAYVAYAKKAIAGGAKPDIVYTIQSLQ